MQQAAAAGAGGTTISSTCLADVMLPQTPSPPPDPDYRLQIEPAEPKQAAPCCRCRLRFGGRTKPFCTKAARRHQIKRCRPGTPAAGTYASALHKNWAGTARGGRCSDEKPVPSVWYQTLSCPTPGAAESVSQGQPAPLSQRRFFAPAPAVQHSTHSHLSRSERSGALRSSAWTGLRWGACVPVLGWRAWTRGHKRCQPPSHAAGSCQPATPLT